MTAEETTARAPDLAEAVIGFRQWRLDDAMLCSPFVDYTWAQGANTARCARAADHAEPAPGHDCTCGLHAWYRPCPRLGYASRDLVGGAVALWGEIELHPTGMRAQHAAIVALALPLPRTTKRHCVLAVADALDVVVVPPRALTAAALDHGRPLAPGLAPSANGV